ncbi:S-layer homology domain-containing protein [Bacillus tropicus]|uniref:Cell wall hydrolase n=1 Tax=Bacillus tropicus TaxID=2026188 RepID=A0A5C5A2J3_9BACI|nr:MULTISPECIES: S-layer homology domain-containing protein [Bacillus]ALL23973.1 cell wall hydrolase [Bacillus thuringiensis]EEM22428.1 cell wall hydrolase/autolysin [Bacillus thuringiensis serovar tochigiensis BGSC 4Y1]MDA1548369.1 S-layer homology domain-containing protein [Bacillus cereus group sp. TH243-3LC]MDA1560065.1 S-layer homology domain-containing protein [Bacillus cereus group sp. TH243-1LC]MDA1642115.1 S-layer homology domain-containing protein [Bacillus cereus group sp. TH177-1LC
MKYKLIATGILAGSLLSYSSSAFANTHKFPDVPNWASPSVNYLVEKGALHGKPDGTFAPAETIDRGSAAKIMAIMLGLEINKNAKPSFQDAQNHWAAPYIAAVEKAGVIKGDGNGNFLPTGLINRASMASMVANAYKLENKVTKNSVTTFEDLKGHWGERYANILIQTEISKGTEDGENWSPNRPITRAEAAQFIAKSDQIDHQTKKEENAVVGVINDADPYYVTVAYKDANGNSQEVTIDFPNGSNSSFKNGDKVKVANKNQWKHQKIYGQTVFYTDVNSISKGNEESNKQQENHVFGVINDADSYYVTVAYKDANGNNQEVTIDFPNGSNSNFKNGDKVKVANKDQWKYQKIYGQTVFYTDVSSISKINEETNKQQENHVMSKDKEQKLLAQLKKRSGTVTKKSEDSLEISSENQTIRAHVNPKVLPNIQIGDTVNVYAQAFEMDPILLMDLPFEARNAIIQKGNEQNILENQYKKIKGNVTGKSDNSILVSSNNITYEVETSTEVLQDIIIGDTVNVYAASFEFSPILLAGVPAKAISPIVEKTN